MPSLLSIPSQFSPENGSGEQSGLSRAQVTTLLLTSAPGRGKATALPSGFRSSSLPSSGRIC